MSTYPHPETSDGWTCPRCGQTMWSVVQHHCWAPPQMTPAQAYAIDPTLLYMRLAEALERIATAVEKLAAGDAS